MVDIFLRTGQASPKDIGLVDPTTAGGGITLTAAFGSFVLTGEAAVFDIGIPTAFGSFTLTGEPVILDTGMPAAFGSFALTGEATTFINGTVMAAAFGSFTETGEAATFDVGMTAEFGAFAFTGEDATLTASGGVTLTADFGSFTFTGSPVVTFTAPTADIQPQFTGNFSGWEGKRTKRERLADAQHERERVAAKAAFHKTLEEALRPPKPPVAKPPVVAPEPAPEPAPNIDTTARDRREMEIAKLREIAAKATVASAEIQARSNLAEIKHKARQQAEDNALALVMLLTA